MKTESSNKNASNDSGARANFQYANMLDQMRYIFALKYTKEKTVLDIACGVGWGSYVMGMAGALKVIAIDLSESAIITAKKYYSSPNIEYICNYLEKSNIASSSIDVITSFETFEHLETPLDMLNEFHRVIAPNGILLLSTPNAYAFKFQKKDKPHNPYHYQEYFKKDIVEMIKDKWDIIDYKGQHLIKIDSPEVLSYRKWIRDYWRRMKLANKFSILGRVAGLVCAKTGLFHSNEPAFMDSCEPKSIINGYEPAYHYFILKPKK